MTTTESVAQVAAKAIIRGRRRRVLIIREAKTGPDNTNVGKWGLPGGRLKSGESFSACLEREVDEETGIDFVPVMTVHQDEWHPTIRGTSNQIIGVFVLCRARSTKVRLSEEHDEYRWIRLSHRHRYFMTDADFHALDAAARRTSLWGFLRLPWTHSH